jgi:ADP-heptose:LPS heptosyltransferase
MEPADMKPSYYREKWQTLKNTAADKTSLSLLAKQIGHSFLDHYYRDGICEQDYIDLICEMATSFQDIELNSAVSTIFFSVIIEELCDDYEDFQFKAYNQVMSRVISYCRNLPAAGRLDHCLNRFHLFSADDIASRAERVQARDYRIDPARKNISKIFVLSRITIGADVAIVSIIIQRLSRIFPDADIILLGSSQRSEIFSGNPRIRIKPFDYNRRGGLLERLSSWHKVLDALGEETKSAGKDEILVIDPDSRILQLGILPIIEEDNYLYFNSHVDWLSSQNVCMAELANAWMDRVFGRADFCYPCVWLNHALLSNARKFTASLLENGCRTIVAISFGFGGNPRKKLGFAFETKLVCELLKQPKTIVILDRGFGAEELNASQQIIDELRNKGYPILQNQFDRIDPGNFSEGLLSLECTTGEIASLIANSHGFIGYDSACQHIAAALSTPTITIFTGSNNPHFIRRWSACGNTSCKVIHVNTLVEPENIDPDEIINRIMEERVLNKT